MYEVQYHDGGLHEADAIRAYEAVTRRVEELRSDAILRGQKGDGRPPGGEDLGATRRTRDVYEEMTAPYPDKSLDGLLCAVYTGQGKALYMANMFSKSVISYTRCLEVDPDYLDAIDARASSYIVLGSYEDAAADSRAVIERDQDRLMFAQAYTGLARVLEAREGASEGGCAAAAAARGQFSAQPRLQAVGLLAHPLQVGARLTLRRNVARGDDHAGLVADVKLCDGEVHRKLPLAAVHDHLLSAADRLASGEILHECRVIECAMRQGKQQVGQVAADGIGRRQTELPLRGRVQLLQKALAVEHEDWVERGGEHGLPCGGLVVELASLLRAAARAEQHFVGQPLEFDLDRAAPAVVGHAAVDAGGEVGEPPQRDGDAAGAQLVDEQAKRQAEREAAESRQQQPLARVRRKAKAVHHRGGVERPGQQQAQRQRAGHSGEEDGGSFVSGHAAAGPRGKRGPSACCRSGSLLAPR
jgi:tetratricopeptide (TPR) repeat protein